MTLYKIYLKFKITEKQWANESKEEHTTYGSEISFLEMMSLTLILNTVIYYDCHLDFVVLIQI